MSTSTELKNIDSKGQAEECIFVKITASELNRKEDWFRKFRPKTPREKEFYKQVRRVIRLGVKDFYRPRLDPSFNEMSNRIVYVYGEKPAVGKSYSWWVGSARSFKPECKSRLGTKNEYIAFLAFVIRDLVANGWQIKEAWDSVCDDSKKLGHYCNSENAKHEFENTGSREVLQFYDFANTYKLLAEDDEDGGMWVGGGFSNADSNISPLACLIHYYIRCDVAYDGTGWIVFEKNPYEI